MTQELAKNLPLLQHWCCTTAGGKAKICKSHRNELCRCIRDVSYNVLKGNLKLNPTTMKRLEPYKSDLRAFASKSVTEKDKLKRLNQHGGAIFPILLPVLSLIAQQLLK
jgi:hypothetical protein